MASEAEVDLLISTAGALPELERDLNRIIRQAENRAPEIDVQASLAAQNSLAVMSTQLDSVVRSLDLTDPTIDVNAALDAQEAIRDLRSDLDEITRAAARGGTDIVDLHAVLDFDSSFALVRQAVGHVVDSVERVTPPIELEVELDERSQGRDTNLNFDLASLRSAALAIGGIGAAAGSAAPLVAGLVTALGQVAPAAALAVSAQLTMQLAANTLKLAMIGVSDAIELAFDPEAKPEDLAKAMENLAPSARAFVTELRDMRGSLTELQQDVQQNFFRNLDQSVKSLAEDALPDVSRALLSTSTSLNRMVRGAAEAAGALGRSGVLGTALEGSTTALRTLERVPGNVVASLGVLGAAAAPAFNRLATAAAGAAERVTEKLLGAFESGALEKSINTAVDLLAQLGRSVGNIFAGLGNIFRTVAGEGDGLFANLEKITRAFRDVTATKGFQDALRALSQTMTVVASTVLPLISQALQALGPIFTTLAPPIQAVVRILGETLGRVLTALGPVLVSVATAFGGLITAVAPLITLAGDLVVALLPALTPLFETLGQVLTLLAPVISEIAQILSAILVPVINGVVAVLNVVMPLFVELYEAILPPLQEILQELQEPLQELSLALNDVIKELTPLFAEVIKVGAAFLKDLLPPLAPLIKLLVELVGVGLRGLTSFLNTFVTPALQALNALLNGDTKKAFEGFNDIATDAKRKVGQAIIDLRAQVVSTLQSLVLEAGTAINNWATDMKRRFGQFVIDASNEVRELPGKIVEALSGLDDQLFSSGSNAGAGFLAGLRSTAGQIIGQALSIANSVVNTINSALQIQSPSKKTEKSGRDAGRGLEKGLNGSRSGVKNAADQLGRTVGEVIGNTTLASLKPITTFFLRGGEEVNRFTREIVNAVEKVDAPLERLAMRVKEAAEGFGLALGETLGATGVLAALQPITTFFLKSGDEVNRFTGEIVNAIQKIDVPLERLQERAKEIKKQLDEGFGLGTGESAPGAPQIDALKPIQRPPGLPPLPTFQNEGTNVVNVFLDGKLVDQRIDDRFRVTQSAQNRLVAQGVRI